MATEADYGADLSCVDDLDPMMRELSGRRLLAESLARRLTMAKGTAIDAPNEGIDLYASISDSAGPRELARIAQQVRAEAMRDTRLLDLTVTPTITGVGASRTLTITMLATDADGPFPLTLTVGAVTSLLLST